MYVNNTKFEYVKGNVACMKIDTPKKHTDQQLSWKVPLKTAEYNGVTDGGPK